MLKIAANISLLFCELPLLERFRAANAAGFEGVEMHFPYTESADALVRAARLGEVPVVLINAPISPEYPCGFAGRPEMRERFRSQLPQIVEYADALHVRHVHVLAGPGDPTHGLEHCREVYAENLILAADALAPYGVGVLVEPLNGFDVPDYLIGTLDDAQAMLARCGQRVRMQFDAYHVTRMGLDAAAELKGLLPIVGHVQFADVPGRHEPGSGTVRFDSLLAVLNAARYEGWAAAEYVPAAGTLAGLGWLAQWRS